MVRIGKVFIAFILLTVAACGGEKEMSLHGALSVNENAPAELSHLKNMIGEWAIEDSILQADGSWAPGPGADWDFYYTLDGYAFEDIWVQPPRAVSVEDETKRTVGVNIRKYDPVAEKWVMAWLTKGPGVVQTFSATSNEDELVMVEDEVNAQGYIRRITFYNMTGDTFDWRMEASTDEGETWAEAYRIKGTKKK